MLAAAAAVGAGELERFTHGTTIATNALLERRGARTALVATDGFEHVLHLRRQDRAHLYRLCARHPDPLVPLERSFGVRGRIGPDGELAPLELDTLPDLGDAEAIAVCLLFSFRDPSHEQAVVAELRRRYPDAHIVASHESAPEFREYERASTTAADAYLGPLLGRYLRALAARCEEAGLPVPLIMRSSGGVAPLEEAAAHAARALLSGPAAGVVGASRVARLAGIENALAFDMGGTSTDVCAIVGGEATRSSERLVGGLPIRLPTLDVHTVGAGGGSIVWRDAGGALRVGPESAGAEPGTCLLRPRRRAADGHRREPAARPAAGPPRRRPRARPRRRRAGAGVGRRGAGGRDRRRQRRDARCAAGRHGRARSRSARFRARRVRRRRRAACVRAGRGAGDRNGARARGGRRALGARARAQRRAARHGALAGRPARRRRAARRRRGGHPLRRSVVRADRPARRRRRPRPSTAPTRIATATPTARRPLELVALRTATVRPGPEYVQAHASARPPATGLVELDGSTAWIPPGWRGDWRDGSLVVTRA